LGKLPWRNLSSIASATHPGALCLQDGLDLAVEHVKQREQLVDVIFSVRGLTMNESARSLSSKRGSVRGDSSAAPP